MDTLPWLPLKKVLSFLDLDEVLRSRAVSRNWRDCIDTLFRTTNLFYSTQKRGHIFEKNRLVAGRFDRNFIASSKFESFFGLFARSILSNLKHLRIYNVYLENRPFFQTLNLFVQLEELDITRISLGQDPITDYELNLPNLKRLRAEELWGIGKLRISESPKLFEIQLRYNSHLAYLHEIRYEVVHTDSIERIYIDRIWYVDLEKFKNLKYLFCFQFGKDASFLPKLEQLKEFHLGVDGLAEVLRQKQIHMLRDLKVYHCGLPVNDLTDLDSFLLDQNDQHPFYRDLSKREFNLYVENSPRLADKIEAYSRFTYSTIDTSISRMPIDFWKKFVNLREIRVDKPIYSKNIRPFLQFLENLENITVLNFRGEQSQDLFNRLPDHSVALQRLEISGNEHLDLNFLFRLKDLTEIRITHRINSDFLRQVLKEFEFLQEFSFLNRFGSSVRVIPLSSQRVEISGVVFSDLNKAIKAMNFGEQSPVKTKSNPRKANRKRF